MTEPKWTQEQTIYEFNAIVTKHDSMLYAGVVTTKCGFVKVESRTYTSNSWTILEFIHKGGLWVRCYDKSFQPRYLVTLAKRFAAEISEAQD